MNYFSRLFRRAAERRGLNELMRLDDHLLTDIGLTRSDILAMRRGRLQRMDRGVE